MCAYNFPDHVNISDQAKSLIQGTINLDPKKRLTLDEILNHAFFNMGNSIPKSLPIYTLSCPPSSNYIKQFFGNSNINIMGKTQSLARFDNTKLVYDK